MEKDKKVFIFGVFDGLHDGHRFFIKQAKKLGGSLVISVAQDSYVEKYKGKIPKNSMQSRIKKISEAYQDVLVIKGDREINTWEGLNHHRPDIILLGYDQAELKSALEKILWEYQKPKLITAKPFNEHTLHSSKL